MATKKVTPKGTDKEVAKPLQHLDALEKNDVLKDTGTEAGGIAWMWIYGSKTDPDGSVYEVAMNITERAKNSELALRSLVDTASVAQGELKMRLYSKLSRNIIGRAPKLATPQPVGQAPQQVGQAPQVTQPAPLPAPMNQPIEATRGPVAGYDTAPQAAITILHITKIIVKQRPNDEKVNLELWCDGRQFPDMYMTMFPDQLAECFQPVGAWTADHFRQTVAYGREQGIDYDVGYRLSQKLNSNGNPFKNFASIAHHKG